MTLPNSIRLVPNLCSSLTNEVYEKLVTENITNSTTLLLQNAEELSAKTRISYKIIQNIRKVLNAYHGASQHSGLDLYNEAINTSAILSTGYECLDEVLGGGLLTEEVTEICGLSGVGKSSLCLSLSLHAASEENKNVLYIDPTHSIQDRFILARLRIINSKQKDIETVLSRIHLLHPSNIWELLQVLENFLNKESKFFQSIKSHLLIIDSFPHLIYPLIGGSQFESFGILNHFWNTLIKVIKLRKMAAVIINHAIKSPADANSVLPHSSLMPALGRYWAHVPHTRLILEKTSIKKNPVSDAAKSTTDSESSEETIIRVVRSTRLNRAFCSIYVI